MNFFVYGCEYNTATDGIIYRGMTNLITEIYPNVEFSYLKSGSRFYRDSTLLPDGELLSGQKFDAILIPGSPFLWHYYYDTPKIKNLLRAKEIHKCPVIWVGIGSCLPYDQRHLFDQIHLEKTKEIYDNDLVFVRDNLAQEIMVNSGVKSTHLVCPSFFSQGISAKTKENLIVFYEPTIGLSWQSWTDPKKLEEYYDIYREFYKNGADVVVKDKEEVEFAEKIGLNNVRVLVDVEDCLNTVKEYKNVLSGRVHCAVPSIISGAKVGLIPIDTRYLTIENFTDCIISNKNELDKIKNLEYNIEGDREEYKKQIREFLKNV